MATGNVKVHVLDLLRQPGARRQLHDVALLDEMAVSSARVPAGSDVAYDIVLEAHGVTVVAKGTVKTAWRGSCRRCLEETSGTVEARVHEIFERDPVVGETWPIAGDQIDLEPVLVQAVLLELPVAPLCDVECLGPAPDRFPTFVEADADDSDGDDGSKPVDRRWDALKELRFD